MSKPLVEPRSGEPMRLPARAPGWEPASSYRAGPETCQDLKRVNLRLERIKEQHATQLRAALAELDAVSYALVDAMRAPLQEMRGFALLLKDSPGEIPIQEKNDNLEKIISASARLEKLIADALTYNRAVLHVLPLQAVNLGSLIPNLIETHSAFDSKHADILIEGGLPTVLGNESLLSQCFSNLLDNAVKFVAPGIQPRVVIRAECTSDFARIWVEDNGIGIPQSSQKLLFQLFQKLNAEYAGTGLGLGIVRKIVERMNGKLGMESKAGQGSRFWVEFRRADTH